MARKKVLQEKQARRFAVVVAILLALLCAYSYLRHHPVRAIVLVGAGVVVFACAFLAPGLWRKAFRAWMKFAELLSFVMTRVILTVFYYGIMTPYGLIVRLLRSDPLDLNWGRRRPSYWVGKPGKEVAQEDYQKQF